MDFVIYAPDYTHRSAGVRALHWLCHRMRELGESAYLFKTPIRNPTLNTSCISDIRALRGPVVAIYPEVVGGNPFCADIVVRWLLNWPGRANKDTSGTWSSSDIKVYWSDSYAEGPAQLLYLPIIDRIYFHNQNNPFDATRSMQFVYSGKAEAAGEPVPTYGPNLCNYAIPTELLGWMLRYSKTLYVCENSIIAVEAEECGCKVEYVLSKYMPKEPKKWEEPTEAQTMRMIGGMIDACHDKALMAA